MSITIGSMTRTITYIFVDDYGKEIPYVEVKIVRFEPNKPYGYIEYEEYITKTDDAGKIVMNLDDKNYHIYARKIGYNIYPDWTLVGEEWYYHGNYIKHVMLYKIPTTPQEQQQLQQQAEKREQEIQQLIKQQQQEQPSEGYVTVRVYDAYKQTPISRAKVTINSYSGSTDSSGIVKIWVTKGEYKITVTKDGYEVYSETIYVIPNMEVGIALTPTEVREIHEIKLSVDKTEIVEGETVTFTVEPAVQVELYELTDQYIYIKTFIGSTTLQPKAGSHTYSAKYNYVYGSYKAEIWSNIVNILVISKQEITPTPTPTPKPLPKAEDRLKMIIIGATIVTLGGNIWKKYIQRHG